MATLKDLAIRVLQKIEALSSEDEASPGDLQKALEKLRSVHSMLKAKRLLRWTLNDIPDVAEEPYVMLASILAAADFGAPIRPEWQLLGMQQIQEAVNLPATGVTQMESF